MITAKTAAALASISRLRRTPVILDPIDPRSAYIRAVFENVRHGIARRHLPPPVAPWNGLGGRSRGGNRGKSTGKPARSGERSCGQENGRGSPDPDSIRVFTQEVCALAYKGRLRPTGGSPGGRFPTPLESATRMERSIFRECPLLHPRSLGWAASATRIIATRGPAGHHARWAPRVTSDLGGGRPCACFRG